MPTTYRTSILHKSRSKTVLKPGKNLRTTTYVYTITALLEYRVLITTLLELNLLA
jgi:hypothetical protein